MRWCVGVAERGSGVLRCFGTWRALLRAAVGGLRVGCSTAGGNSTEPSSLVLFAAGRDAAAAAAARVETI